MGCQELETSAQAKRYINFGFLHEDAYLSHCQDINISVNCVNDDLGTSVSTAGGIWLPASCLKRTWNAVYRSDSLLKTSSVMISSLSASRNTSWRMPERKLNNSVFFSLILRKLAKLPGIIAVPTTHLLIPFQCLAIVVAFNKSIL